MAINLSRLLRPTTFESVVGHSFLIRMIRNSLYLGRFFPVYLFYGQRGCGKTTLGRILARALNCERLDDFAKAPQSTIIPCQACESCCAMEEKRHPDFIELDAASHTGVDNIRSLIESSTYLPSLGKKRVYLIDEAHMLSKSAFNAFLKTLEEPPEHAVFILATTEVSKIPLTVRSRAFLGPFSALCEQEVTTCLRKIATDLSIDIEEAALIQIFHITEGCMRDAVNLFEQLITLQERITLEVVQRVFRTPNSEKVITIVHGLFTNQKEKVLMAFSQMKEIDVDPSLLWAMIIEIVHEIFKRILVPSFLGELAHQGLCKDLIDHVVKVVPLDRVQAVLASIWEIEESFLHASDKYRFLEFFFMRLMLEATDGGLKKQSMLREAEKKDVLVDLGKDQEKDAFKKSHDVLQKEEQILTEKKIIPSVDLKTLEKPLQAKSAFLFQLQAGLAATKNSLLATIFEQACSYHIDVEGFLSISFLRLNDFLRQQILDYKADWLSIAKKLDSNIVDGTVVGIDSATAVPEQKRSFKLQGDQKQGEKSVENNAKNGSSVTLEVAEQNGLKTVSAVAKMFGGSIKKRSS